ncbi:MAG TPA: hypothetical protein VFR67_13775, partial [Pilimelia sp.]|nr:hypothetical protein [Pilimelia sp.]
MTGEPEVPQDAGPAGDGGLPVPGRRVRRWMAPVAVAVAVMAVVAASRPVVDKPERGLVTSHGSEPHGQARMPRFLVTAGGSVATGTREGTPRDGVPPWFQVQGIGDGTQRLVDSVQPPSPSAGEVQEIVTGPGGM